jgi:hypothetical protein
MDKIILEQLKVNVISFFQEKQYLKSSDIKSHKLLYDDLIRSLNVKVEVSDHGRNYNHCDDLYLYLHPIKGFINNYGFGDRVKESEYIENEGREIVVLQVSLSDVGPYAIYSLLIAKSLRNGEDKDVIFNGIELVKVNESISNNVKLVFDKIEKHGFIIFNSNELTEKKDWLEDEVKFEDKNYRPTILELLIGGFDFYSQANI